MRAVLTGIVAGAMALAGGAALTDWRAGNRAAAAERAFPAEGRMLTVDGLRLHAVVKGNGPDLVMIHGASGSLRDFTFDLTGRLAPHFRVIAFDRPGLGLSDAPPDAAVDPRVQAALLRRAAGKLGVRDPLVLGHSYGGAVAMAWALAAHDRPEAGPRPAGLVLLAGATHPWPGELGPWYRIAATGFGQRVAIPLVSAFAPESRVLAVLDSIFAPQPAPPGYAGHIGLGLSLRRDALRANALQVQGLKPHVAEMAPRYAALDLPIEILHGTEDTIVGLSIHSERMASEVSGAALSRMQGIGHMPHHADPDAVMAAIARAAARAGLRPGG